jgi:hypothetical protein
MKQNGFCILLWRHKDVPQRSSVQKSRDGLFYINLSDILWWFAGIDVQFLSWFQSCTVQSVPCPYLANTDTVLFRNLPQGITLPNSITDMPLMVCWLDLRYYRNCYSIRVGPHRQFYTWG